MQIMRSIVFREVGPELAVEKLKQSHKRWMIRESSSHPGMITLDMKKDNGSIRHYRFAYHTKRKQWIQASSAEQLKKALETMEPIRFIATQFDNQMSNLLRKLEASFNLNESHILTPENHEAAVNNAYMVLFENQPQDLVGAFRERMELENSICPITQEALCRVERVGILNHRFYDYDAVREWLDRNGTDPITRAQARVEDVRLSEINRLM